MARRRFRFLQSLTVRLFVLMTALVIGAFAVLANLNLATHRAQVEARMAQSAMTLADVIRRSAWHAMMENDRGRVAQIIGDIGKQDHVVAARLYNKQGEVVVATDEAEVGQRVDEEAEACAACHVGGDLHEAVPEGRFFRQVNVPAGTPRVLGVISPIRNEAACATGGCHPPPDEQRILGVLDVQVSLAEADTVLDESRATMLTSGVVVAALTAIAAGLFIWFMVRRPVRRLIRGTKAVAQLDLDVEFGRRPGGEIGDLIRNFEHMARALKRAHDENKSWAATLEQRVDEKTRELRRAQAHLVHVEKMASLGKLSAVVAHEINNPLTGVLTYARLVRKRIAKLGELSEDDRARLEENLAVIDSETRRCGEIVKNMLLFSRRKPEGLAEAGLRDVIQKAVRLVQHAAEMNQVEVSVDLGDGDDRVVCNADQIQQAMVALLVNATEAMPDGGTLGVELRAADDRVSIVVSDTGTGIPEEIQERIFEPFFTTKDAESGVGLGLAVVHGIIKAHGGSIMLASEVGEGTQFRIALPRVPPARHQGEGGGGRGERRGGENGGQSKAEVA